MPNTAIKCPQCGSERLYKDGLRYLANGEIIQRLLCRNCGYRFSQTNRNHSDKSQHVQKVQRQILNSPNTLPLDCQGRYDPKTRAPSAGKAVQTLVEVETRTEKPQREGTQDQATIKGLITKYMAHLESEGYYPNSSYLDLIKRLVKLGANLLNPEDVKKVISQAKWKDSTKKLAVCAYDIMVRQLLKIDWNPPEYKQKDSLPFVPTEKELDQIIASCKTKRMMTFLQTLKETFADPGEILRLEWKDISDNIITINNPVKGHNAGQVKISNKLASMLNSLPKTSNKVFPTRYHYVYLTFRRLRQRLACELKNPRFNYMALKSFRHWGGTMIAHITNGNVLEVKKALRHKSIMNTMKYIHMIAFKDDEFDVATATTVEEIKKLATAGFQKFDELNGIHVFRRPKRFTYGNSSLESDV